MLAGYLILLSLTSIILSAHDSDSESEEKLRILSELLESQCSLISLVSNVMLLDACV